jgi:hypothetical protein
MINNNTSLLLSIVTTLLSIIDYLLRILDPTTDLSIKCMHIALRLAKIEQIHRMIDAESIMVELGVANDKLYKQCSNGRIQNS